MNQERIATAALPPRNDRRKEERIATGPMGPRNDMIVDVPMHLQRDLATVTAEIRAYQDAARRMAINYSIEIGRRLVEAKQMVEHGEWSAYLRDELGFSQSTANNHMRMFEAYGAEQMTMTGAALKNQAFADLSYTQALALLALPSEDEREQFVEQHDMDELSTRQLQAEIRRQLDEAEERARVAETSMDAALIAQHNAEAKLEAAEKASSEAEQQMQSAREQAKLLEARANAKQAEAMEAKAEADKLRAQLTKAKDDQTKTRAKLKELRENPEIPEEILEKHRKEAQEAAEKAALAEIEAKTRELAEKLEAAEKAASEATAQSKAAEEQAAALRKELSLAAPELAVFAADFERVQGELFGLITRAKTMRGEAGEKSRKAMTALIQNAFLEMEGNQ